MPERFFLDAAAVTAGRVAIGGVLAHHLARSLRVREGDAVVVVAGGVEHGVRLDAVAADHVGGQVEWTRDATGEPRLRITVVQALPRERMEDCIDILVEVGASEVRPVITEHVVTRASSERLAARALRWQAVAQESAQLAGRGMIPIVHPPARLDIALADLDAGTRIVACTFDAEQPIAELEVDAAQPLALCIGPEGGFGPRDLDTLRDAGAHMVHAGARVLRTRYAGAIACALLLARAGDLAAPIAAAPWHS